jgi:hypothetical protein
MAVGEITRDGYPYLILNGLTKTNTAVATGAVVFYDTDGWGPSGSDGVGPHGIAMNTQTATAVTQKQLSVMVQGCVMAKKTAGAALAQGQAVKTDGTSLVVVVETTNNSQMVVGVVLSAALSAATEVEILIHH